MSLTLLYPCIMVGLSDATVGVWSYVIVNLFFFILFCTGSILYGGRIKADFDTIEINLVGSHLYCTRLCLPQNPRIASRVLLKNSKSELLHVGYDRCIWLSAFFSYFSASLLLTLLYSGAIPPVVGKATGLNEDFSISFTLWLYLSFSFSCCW